MERWVVGAGIVLAGLLAVGAVVGDGFHFNHSFHNDTFWSDDSGSGGSPTPAGAAALAPGAEQSFLAESVALRDAVAVLRVIPEDRSDFSVSVTGGERLPPLRAAVENGQLVLDGELDGRLRSCQSSNGRRWFNVSALGRVELSEAPVVTVRAPRDLKLATAGAVMSEIPAVQSAELEFAGCGDASLGPVAGRLSLVASGSGDIEAASVGEAEVNIRGAGDVALGAVGGPLKARLAGSGSLTAGDIAGRAELDLAGSGEMSVGAVAGPLGAKLGGSGDMRVASGSGEVELALAGSGDLTVAGGRAGALRAKLAGSGDLSFLGEADSLDAAIAGSGDIRVRRVVGAVQKSVAGSGDVIIG